MTLLLLNNNNNKNKLHLHLSLNSNHNLNKKIFNLILIICSIVYISQCTINNNITIRTTMQQTD